ncbi:hypothetical protein G7085_09485 [Tessaracoccus sp. HDW20]|uniref:hypothetical protein n=1 Tax=Tessaracoccus coleopterorum TaxID=2714950 RepID=UPI0018D3A429|nr:hypothetical protein [Tessaracoccus coleopterorum]
MTIWMPEKTTSSCLVSEPSTARSRRAPRSVNRELSLVTSRMPDHDSPSATTPISPSWASLISVTSSFGNHWASGTSSAATSGCSSRCRARDANRRRVRTVRPRVRPLTGMVRSSAASSISAASEIDQICMRRASATATTSTICQATTSPRWRVERLRLGSAAREGWVLRNICFSLLQAAAHSMASPAHERGRARPVVPPPGLKWPGPLPTITQDRHGDP